MSLADSAQGPERTRVAVIGLGSIGGVIAGLLAALERHDVVACVRRPIERRPSNDRRVRLRFAFGR